MLSDKKNTLYTVYTHIQHFYKKLYHHLYSRSATVILLNTVYLNSIRVGTVSVNSILLLVTIQYVPV